MAPAISDSTLDLPRILCLHGGGTNATIFKAQCRALRAQTHSEFRFVFVQGPFDSNAGSDVLSVYSEWGPFKRWLRWRPHHPELQAEDIVNEIDMALEDAIQQDDACGATGEWIALLGFSQGAKVSASLLYRQQVREAMGLPPITARFRFGVLMAGSAPLVALDPSLEHCSGLPDASQLTDRQIRRVYPSRKLHIPTLHVHGLRDKGKDLHRRLYKDHTSAESRHLVEWDGDHRLPLKSRDVAMVVAQIRRLARETQTYSRQSHHLIN